MFSFDFVGRVLTLPPVEKEVSYDTARHIEIFYSLLQSLGLLDSLLSIAAHSLEFLNLLGEKGGNLPAMKKVVLLAPSGLMDKPMVLSFVQSMCCRR